MCAGARRGVFAELCAAAAALVPDAAKAQIHKIAATVFM
jgi:hypothetical protein